MIHSASPQSRPAMIVALVSSFGTYGQTDNLCENTDHYQPELFAATWINRRQTRKEKRENRIWKWKIVSRRKWSGCDNFTTISEPHSWTKISKRRYLSYQ